MDKVDINGVGYEKASLLAKEFRYTSDYIGQLCRSRKVDAQLVGRTWYVNRESLTNHKTSRYSKIQNASDEKMFKYKVEINKSRIDVEPFLKPKVVKMIQSKDPNFSKRINWKPIKYEPDRKELLPNTADQIGRIKVDLADSKKIRVSGLSSETKLQAEDLPSVVLSGNVSVSSLDYEFEVNDSILDKKPSDFIAEIDNAVVLNNDVEDEDFDEMKDSIKSDLLDNQVNLIPRKIREIKVKEQEVKTKKRLGSILIFILSIFLILSVFVELRVNATALGSETSFYFSTNTLSIFF